MNSQYKVEHYYPKFEGEYRNGVIVSSVYYREDNLLLSFTFSYEKDLISTEEGWVLTLPSDFRDKLGKRWKDKNIILNRVIEFLKSLDSLNMFIMGKREIDNVKIDSTNLPSFLQSITGRIRNRFRWLEYTLPSKNILILLALGFLLAYFINKHDFLQDFSSITPTILIALGVTTTILLIKDILKDLNTFTFIGAVAQNGLFSARMTALKIIFSQFGRRYIITLILTMVLIKTGIDIA